jgi:hypothetical protein
MAKWRIGFAIAGLALAGMGAAAIVYALTPAFHLEPAPGYALTLAVVTLLVAARLLWWAFAPTKPPRRPGAPDG